MPTKRGNVRGRLQSLRNRHAELSAQLENELKHPRPSEMAMKRLKLEKLRIKEEIEMEASSG
ncbi:MAG: YdcH family protein [Alphaproteobacteria bacterium]|nr:YdcH family protein [Alphaproteobacteria bacterium]